MKLLKSIIIAVAITASMGVASSAIAAGKIENATTADVMEAIEQAITGSAAALDGLKNGSKEEAVLESVSSARQATKRIEVGTTLDPTRSRASTQLRTANAAVKNGEKDKAEAALIEAIKGFEEIKANYK